MHSRCFFFIIFAIFLLLINFFSLASSVRTQQSGKVKYCDKRFEHWRDRASWFFTIFFRILLVFWRSANGQANHNHVFNSIIVLVRNLNKKLKLNMIKLKEERIATKCCQNGCELEDIKEACCFTQACLNRCYPGKGYRVGSVYK